jgi:nucleoid-associated protein YgaU
MFCCLTAHVANNNIELQNNHPDHYVFVIGDTLGDISAKFLKDLQQWPHIWKTNIAEISNPHLIYPGDVIVLTVNHNSLY